ncbi:SAM-dependent methyltransferase [Bacillus thuringiensis]|nr:SAM-dependent methyltransferase [Bacillus thuringiensis]PGM90209.1 SAM-dependent methyltransferase [Bacillus cereus]PES74940.1 SAM-dependent methyltransferase [Bacillus thuringiensis]PEZ62057.1 SAM-dependent methyltransferase [Bacillus thuringiensis]PFE08060.1 SAM-dependent methyltransferase [Bacillus thuringiensis]
MLKVANCIMKDFVLEKENIIRKYGEWTAYDIKLTDTLYTRDIRQPNPALKKIVTMIRDITQCDFKNLRILDLACLEGHYAIEFAMQGATVVGIEGRESNIQKAIFAKDLLRLENLTFYQDDVRNLSVEKYGQFDIVLCSGILYHLDCSDVFPFLEKVHEVCKRFVIIDTHITSTPNVSVLYKNYEYKGHTMLEHSANSSIEERLKSKWASLDNVTSFWMTKSSLYNFLTRTGFSSINESRSLVQGDRITVVAFKKYPIEIKSSPETEKYIEPDYLEC